jgi:hypothetical protein
MSLLRLLTVKLSLCLTCHADILGSVGIVPPFLHLCARWRWVVIFTAWPLFPWGQFLSNYRIGGWMDPRDDLDPVKNRKILAPVGNWTSGVHPVARRYTDWATPVQGYSQVLQVSVKIAPEDRKPPSSLTFSPIHHSSVILSFRSTKSKLLTALQNKP